MIVSKKFVLLIFIYLLSYITVHAQHIEQVSITQASLTKKKLSDFSKKTSYVVLKSSTDNPLYYISQVYFLGDKILVIDSNNENHSLPKRLSIFNESGEFIKYVGTSMAIAVDESAESLYALANPEKVNVYNYKGQLIDAIDIKGGQNISFYNGLLWVSTYQINDGNNMVSYGLIAITPKKNEKKEVFSFQYEDRNAMNGVNILSNADFFTYKETLYWAHGIADHIYSINKATQLAKVKITFLGFDRSYDDEILSRYALINGYLYFKHNINMRANVFMQDLSTGKILHIESQVIDDVYHTGTFKLKGALKSNRLFFTKGFDDLPEAIINTYKIAIDDKLLIYSNQ